MNISVSKSLLLKTIIVMIMVLFSFSSVIGAEELTFEEAVRLGKKNNYEFEQKREAIKDLEREKAVLKAGIDWYLGFDSGYNYNTGGPEFDSIDIIEKGDSLGFTIKGGKTTLNGLSISSELSLENNDPFEFKDIDKKYNFKLDVSKRLYPILPTDTEKGFIQTDNKLIIAEAELDSFVSNQEVDWLENYLKVLRLSQRLKYSKIAYQLALDDLSKVKAQLEIGEAGQKELLMAEISLQEARLDQDQLTTSMLQAEDSLELEMGLVDNSIEFIENDSFVDSFIEKADTINTEVISEKVVGLIKKNNVQLREIMLNKDYAENELKWQLKENDVKVDTYGSYSYNATSMSDDKDNVQVGVGISYDFLDGGQQKLTIEGTKAKIKNLEKEYSHTLEQLKLELKGMLDQQKVNKMKLKYTETGLEKARLEEKLYKNQFDVGLVTETQYKQKILAVNQAEIDYKEARDQILLAKLRIALLLGLY